MDHLLKLYTMPRATLLLDNASGHRYPQGFYCHWGKKVGCLKMSILCPLWCVCKTQIMIRRLITDHSKMRLVLLLHRAKDSQSLLYWTHMCTHMQRVAPVTALALINTYIRVSSSMYFAGWPTLFFFKKIL